MRNLKKILALVLALMMVLSVMVTASAAFEDADSINPAYEKAVEVMAAAGILNGMGDGTFAPTGNLTRAQAAKLIAYLAAEGDVEDIVPCETVFDDVATSNGVWASGFIAYCYEKGIINGMSATEYAPDANISVEAYAKLLLGVLGVEGTYTGDKWYVAVRNNAIANKLMTGMTYTWTADITREQAAQMTFNAMKVGEYSYYTYHVVPAGETTPENSEAEYEDITDAYIMKNILGDSFTVIRWENTVGALLSNFLVDYGMSVDLYGRPSDNYTYLDADGDAQTLYFPEAADFVYTSATKASTIAKELKGYILPVNATTSYKVESDTEAKFTNAATAIVTVDTDAKASLKAATGLAADDTFTASEILAALTGNNAVVEIFADKDKNIEAIVVTNTFIGEITDVIEADEETGTPEMIEVDSAYYTVNTGFAEGDKVTYTVCGAYAENVAEAEYIVGTLTAYTSTDTYTVNGTVYTLDRLATAKAATIKGKYGAEYAYYLGANNTIIDATAVPGTAPAVLTDYAMVVDSDAAVKVTSGTWMGQSSTTIDSVVAQVYVITADGTAAIYDLDVVKAGAAISGTSVAKGDYYTKIAGSYVVLVDASNTEIDTTAEATAAAQTALSTALNTATVYTYKLEENVITLAGTLAAFVGTETESTVAHRKLDTDITATSTTLNVTSIAADIIINDKTVFILKDTDRYGNVSIVVKTGAAALQATDGLLAQTARVVVDVNVTEAGNINVAKVVFAQNVEFDAATVPAEVVEDVVLIDGVYTTTYTASGAAVYTYAAVNAKGEVLSLVGAADLALGLYTYNEDGEIEAQVDEGLVATGVISGNIANLGGEYLVVNDKTVVTDLTGEGFETGCVVLYVLSVDAEGIETNVVSNIFVLVAAE